MYREPAPTRFPGEPPGEFIKRVIEYLTEPDRRRLGESTANDVLLAVEQLERESHGDG